MSTQINVAVAFGAGLLSFLSPCVLPLVPGYLSFVSGVNLAAARAPIVAAEPGDAAGLAQAEAAQAARDAVTASRGTVIANSAMFVLGFSVIFILLGASATALGGKLLEWLPQLSKAAGVLLVLFGLHMTGLIPIKALYMEKRFHVAEKPLGLLGAFVVGCAFAFGWTPCIGPVLGGILTIASSSDSVWEGILLLAAYSAGLGVPFMATALAINRFYAFFDRFKAHFRKVEIVSGVLLMAVGVLIFTGSLSQIATWFPFLEKFQL